MGVAPAQYGALLAAIVALIVALSVAIYATTALDDGTAQRALAGPRAPHDPAAPVSTGTWVGSWSTPPSAAEPGTEAAGLHDRSVRNVVHTSAGGTAARITLSNHYGRLPLTVTHATIALAAADDSAAAVPETMRPLTFGGTATVVVPPGRQVTSDAVRLAVPPDSDVLVSTYAPAEPGPVTVHSRVRQISYAAPGDRAADVTGAPYTRRVEAWRYLTALDVLSRESHGTLVAFGDSLTEGHSSTVGANRRWPDVLADRLREAAARAGTCPGTASSTRASAATAS
ncbi:hypothetical protein GCM10020295_51920 [Streptomyces cinereospinus]